MVFKHEIMQARTNDGDLHSVSITSNNVSGDTSVGAGVLGLGSENHELATLVMQGIALAHRGDLYRLVRLTRSHRDAGGGDGGIILQPLISRLRVTDSYTPQMQVLTLAHFLLQS